MVLKPNSRLMYDLGMNSLEMGFLFVVLEQEFNLKSGSVDVAKIKLPFLTVEKLARLVEFEVKQSELHKAKSAATKQK